MTRDEPEGVRSPELLQDGALTPWRTLHGDGPLTDAEAGVFLKGRMHAWAGLPDTARRSVGFFSYIGMTEQELVKWVLTGKVLVRVRKVWRLS